MDVEEVHRRVYDYAWGQYELLLSRGFATEVARNVLPVGIYTSWYMTGNLHAWFNFLHLRDGEVGHPQYEIVQLAQQVWPIIEEHWPIAASAWKEKNG
jgi:thymidylate synthase (FAD)